MDSSIATLPTRMTVEQFIAWAIGQPETEHYELYGGEVIPMAPERVEHGRVKTIIGSRLLAAIEGARLDCAVFVDDMLVRIDPETAFEPDVLVCCAPLPDPQAWTVTTPIIVVEVLSPSTSGIDKAKKLTAYMQLVSIRHYLIVDVEKRTVIHHRRDADGQILTMLQGDTPIRLDPPGILLEHIFGRP